MLKSEIRKIALQQRRQISDQEFLLLNERLLAQFQKLDLAHISSIHVFLPIINKREPDTFLLLDWLEKHHPGKTIVVSKSDFETNLMSHFTYSGKADLIENRYHIPEPQKAAPFDGILDMVLVPLLAFDQSGNRVGYGKGFYDRFLSGIQTVKVGISLCDEPVEINDVHLNDVKLDLCITPKRIIEFKQA